MHGVAQGPGRRLGRAVDQLYPRGHRQAQPAERSHARGPFRLGEDRLGHLEREVAVTPVEQGAHQLQRETDADEAAVGSLVGQVVEEPDTGARGVSRPDEVAVPAAVRRHPDPQQSPGDLLVVAVELTVDRHEPVTLHQHPVELDLAAERAEAPDEVTQRRGPLHRRQSVDGEHGPQGRQPGQRRAHRPRAHGEVGP